MPSIFVNAHSFYYEAMGEQGDPLIFLSGLGGDHRAFGLAQRYFAARYRTLAFDARDAGQSDRARAAYTTEDMADDVAAWLEAIDVPPAHVLGQSLGGLVAQQLVLRHPRRVKSLMLVSSHAGSNEWRRAVVDSWVLLRRQVPVGNFTRATLPWLVGPPFYQHQNQVDGLVRFAEKNPWPQDAEAFARQARSAMGHDARRLLGSVDVPCLVLSGELDLVNPPRIAGELSGLIRGSKLVVMPGVGHMPHIEDKANFRRHVEEFLGEIAG
ncbi:alpha/beta fold hydrolase [Aquisphaera insulae]|uniref:alpha/beta fold hydrolase n=1 Tax=Aquisphaera insulae TaxID=2712864 RepID=UPI0013ECC4A0|nr:alpha/beta hydrolase [Aquisphaera insulae]